MNRYEVWYSIESYFLKDLKSIVDKKNLWAFHALVAIVYAKNTEEVFYIMNGQSDRMPNPLECANAQAYILDNQVIGPVRRTSMSVGDVIVASATGEAVMVKGIGWEVIN